MNLFVRLLALFLSGMVVIGTLVLLFAIWYVTLPILLVLMGIGWVRQAQIERTYHKMFRKSFKKKTPKNPQIIDVEFEEIQAKK